MSKRILIASLLWSPDRSGMEQQAAEVQEHLLYIRDQWKWLGLTCDWLLIDVGVTDPVAECTLHDIQEQTGALVTVARPSINWGGGKNRGLKHFMEGDYDLCVQFDQDTVMPETAWPKLLLEFHERHPDALAFSLSGRQHGAVDFNIGGETVWRLPGFLGGAMVFTRKGVERLGGFNVKDLHPYGFQDAEYGARLMHCPDHLAALHGAPYVNPIRLEWMLSTINLRATNTAYAGAKSGAAGRLYGTFMHLCQQHRPGNICLPIDDDGPTTEGLL